MKTNIKHKANRRYLSLVFVIILVLLSYSSFALQNGKQENKINVDLRTAYFDKIVVKSGFILNLDQNTELPNCLNIKSSEKQLKNLKFVVKDSVLEIYSTKKIDVSEMVEVNVSFDFLKSIETKGVVEINTVKNLHLNKLTLFLSQESNVSLFISSLDFLCDASGSGNLSIEGDITNFRLNVEGDVEVESNLFSHVVYLYLQGNSQAIFKGQTDYLQIKAINESYLNASNLEARECLLTVSDYGDINIAVSEKLEITGTKEGTVVFKGNPAITNYYISESVVVKGGLKNKRIKDDLARSK